MKLRFFILLFVCVAAKSMAAQTNYYFCRYGPMVHPHTQYFSSGFVGTPGMVQAYHDQFRDFLIKKYGITVFEGNTQTDEFGYISVTCQPSTNQVEVNRQIENERVYQIQHNSSVVMTGWAPVPPYDLHTTTGQGANEVRALLAAEHSAWTLNTRVWIKHTCTEGTKLASQYAKTTVPWWTCSLDYGTSLKGDHVARYAMGIGDTEDAAVAKAKAGTSGAAAPPVISFDVPVCTTETVHATQYAKTMKTQVVCSLTYSTGSNQL